MGQITTSIQLMDNVTKVLAGINRSIDSTVSAFERMDGTSGASFSDARKSIVQVSSQLEELNDDMARVNEPLRQQGHLWSGIKGKILGAVSAYAGFQSVKSLIGLSDTVSQTTARLDLMNDGLQSTNKLSKMIYNSAGRSRGEYLATADAVSKLGTMAGDAFKSSEEIIAFTEQLNKQFTIAGTSIEGQQAAMLQLTQAMGSGALRGEELNSVLEQAPNIVQTIADYMKKPKGAIKDLASEGKITSDIVKKALLSAADETNKKFDSMPKTFGQTWIEIKNAAVKSFEGISTQLSEALNGDQVKELVQNIIAAIPGAVSALSELLEYAMQAGRYITDHWSTIKPVLGGVLSGFLAFKAVTATAGAIEKVTDSVKTFQGILSALKGKDGIFSFFKLGKVGLIIAGIAAVVAAIAFLWNYCEGFRNGVKKVWGAVKDAFTSAWGAITDFFTVTVPEKFQSALDFFRSIPGFFQGIWDTVKGAFVSAWNAIAENPVLQVMVASLKRLWEHAKNAVIGIWNGMKQIAGGIWTAIKNVVLGPILLLIDLITGNFTKLKEDAVLIWNNLKTAASNIWNGIKNVIGSLAQGVVAGVRGAWNTCLVITRGLFTAIKNFLLRIWNAMKSGVVNAAVGIKNGAVKGFQAMVEGIKSRCSRIKETVKTGFDKAIEWIKTLPAKAVGWGKDFVQGLIDGITSKISGVVDAASALAEKIRSFLHFSRPDIGPLRDYETWMPDFMKGLSLGIKSSKDLVLGQIKDLAARMQAIPLNSAYTMQTNWIAESVPVIPTSAVGSSTNTTNNNQSTTKNIYLTVHVEGEEDEKRFFKKLQQILEEGADTGAEGVEG